jgi:hypothetical protein
MALAEACYYPAAEEPRYSDCNGFTILELLQRTGIGAINQVTGEKTSAEWCRCHRVASRKPPPNAMTPIAMPAN